MQLFFVGILEERGVRTSAGKHKTISIRPLICYDGQVPSDQVN